jgi:cytochrome P450/nucleoside-diphosphate-sugar epimerase
MQIVLVTGGRGFLGRATVNMLVERGYRVRCLVRTLDPGLADYGVEQVLGDLVDPAAVLAATKGVDAVVHAAAKTGVFGSRQDYYKANVLGTTHVIQACKAQGVQRLVFTGSPSAVFPNRDQRGDDESISYAKKFLNPYAETKALAEREVLLANDRQLATVSLRPHLIWGPGDPHFVSRIIAKGRSQRLWMVGRGDNLVDTVYIDNAAMAHVIALEQLHTEAPIAGKAFFITNQEPWPLGLLFNRILAAADLPPVCRRLPTGLAYYLGGAMESLYHTGFLTREPPLSRFVALQLGKDHWYSSQAAREVLGYRPKVSMAEGLERLSQSLRAERQKEWEKPAEEPALGPPSWIDRCLAKVPLPGVLQAMWAIRDPEGFFRTRSGGAELFTVKLPGFSTIYVTGSAVGAREMLGAPPEVYRTIVGSPIDAVFGPNSMMAVDGDRHQRQRRLIMPCFGPGRTQELSLSFAAIVHEHLASMPDRGITPLQEEMQELALKVVIQVIFGVKDPEKKARFTRAILDFVKAATSSLLLVPQLRHRRWPPWRRFLRAQAQMDRCLFEQIHFLKQHPDQSPDCLLKTMLHIKDPSGDSLTDDELRDELRTLLVAGHETTATSLTWAFYYSLKNPTIYQRLCEEVRGAGNDVRTYDQLPYLAAVCQEALRIHSVPPFAFRTLRQPLTIRGKTLQPGDNAALCLMLLHSDRRVFEDPQEFRPERFLGRKYGLYEFLPFGSGVRRCIASAFALTEMRVMIATLLRHCDMRLAKDVRPKLVLKHINSGPDRQIPVEIALKTV